MSQTIEDNAKVKVANKTVIDGLTSRDDKTKLATEDFVNEYLKTKIWEDGIYRALYEPQVYTGELRDYLGTETPAITFPIEPDVPKVVTVPFAANTEVTDFTGKRGFIVFNQIKTRRFRKSKWLLKTEMGDIRQYLTDKSVFQIHTEEDERLFGTVDAVLSNGTNLPEQALNFTDAPLWREMPGGWSKDTFVDCGNLIKLSRTDSSKGIGFRAHTIIINEIRASDMMKWEGDSISDKFQEELEEKGWARTQYMGKQILITGKRDIVRDNEVYIVGPRKHSARTMLLNDISIYSKAEGEMLEWYSGEVIGLTIAPHAWAKATLLGV